MIITSLSFVCIYELASTACYLAVEQKLVIAQLKRAHWFQRRRKYTSNLHYTYLHYLLRFDCVKNKGNSLFFFFFFFLAVPVIFLYSFIF